MLDGGRLGGHSSGSAKKLRRTKCTLHNGAYALPHGSGNPFGDHYCTSCKKYREGEHGLSLPLCERVEARALPVKGRDGIRVKLDLKLKLGGRRDMKYCRRCEAELGQI